MVEFTSFSHFRPHPFFSSHCLLMLISRASRHKECHFSCYYFPEYTDLFPMICSCITCVVCVFCASALTELGLQHKHMCSCPPLFTVPGKFFYTLYLSACTLLLRFLLAGLSSCHFNTKPVYRRRFNDRSHFVHRCGNCPVCTNAFRAWFEWLLWWTRVGKLSYDEFGIWIYNLIAHLIWCHVLFLSYI